MLSQAFKLTQYLVLAYFLLSVVYTTHFLLSGWSSFWVSVHHESDTSLVLPRENSYTVSADRRMQDLFNSVSSENSLVWPRTLLEPALPVSVAQETLLAKAFAQSLHPTKIIPYYYRASSSAEKNDVTITTLVTRNRFKVLKQLVERYNGDVIAVFLRKEVLISRRSSFCYDTHSFANRGDRYFTTRSSLASNSARARRSLPLFA